MYVRVYLYVYIYIYIYISLALALCLSPSRVLSFSRSPFLSLALSLSLSLSHSLFLSLSLSLALSHLRSIYQSIYVFNWLCPSVRMMLAASQPRLRMCMENNTTDACMRVGAFRKVACVRVKATLRYQHTRAHSCLARA
jgi:hypothetical protein